MRAVSEPLLLGTSAPSSEVNLALVGFSHVPRFLPCSPHGRSDLSPDSTTHPGPSREQGPLWPLRALHPLGGGALWTTAGKPGLQPYSACLPGQRTRFLMPQLRPRAAKEILTIKKQQKKQPQQSRPSGAKPQRSGTTRFWLSGSHGTPSRRSNMANESFQSTWPGDEFPRKRG